MGSQHSINKVVWLTKAEQAELAMHESIKFIVDVHKIADSKKLVSVVQGARYNGEFRAVERTSTFPLQERVDELVDSLHWQDVCLFGKPSPDNKASDAVRQIEIALCLKCAKDKARKLAFLTGLV